MTPTQRSLKYLREQGYTVAITERWNPFARIRQEDRKSTRLNSSHMSESRMPSSA